MNEQQALSRMVSPGQQRPGKYRSGVIQIWVTRACDKACFGCTQGSNLAGNPGMITPEQFEQACISLKDYFGVAGMFGGNPAMHPKFETLCGIMRKHITYEHRGIWSNNPLGMGKVMRDTFNPSISNLNVHLDRQAYDEFKKDWPECRPVGLDQDSRHSPVHLAMKDVIADEEKRWELIANCDINQHWSAMMCVFRGELRAFFCEVAGAQAMLHQYEPDYPDTGLRVEPLWWARPMTHFIAQVKKHCHECGVPLRGYGELAQSEVGKEQTSATHLNIFRVKKKDRPVEVVNRLEQLGVGRIGLMTDYLGNAKR
jgi:hypothetical protein